MLASLYIQNFTIVSELELDFQTKTTAFTGETGAGKSIMVDALMLAMGARADASVVRKDTPKCTIIATFIIAPESNVSQWLARHEIEAPNQEIILRRVIYQEGRSKSYINDHPHPLQTLKNLSQMLVHIHGQHQHQTLLHHATHREQLDHFSNHDNLISEVETLFKQYQSIKKAIEAIAAQENAHERKILLTYQLDELETIAPKSDEMKQLNQEHQMLHHAHSYLSHIEAIQQLLHEQDEFNINQALHKAIQALATLPKENASVQTIDELLGNALIQCEEASNELKRLINEITLDPNRLEEVEKRISILHDIARKHRIAPDDLLAHQAALSKELSQLNNAEQERIQLEKQLLDCQKAYSQAASRLSQSRKQKATILAKKITDIIQQLGMPKGYVEIQITPLEGLHAFGQDKIEYLVCTNPGSHPDALSKVVSGGELSRISLAILLITAQVGATPTLFFDEVDVGIGGATAALIGKKLRELGERLQVFCVTHQPQVAACAHHHYLVEKNSDDHKTFSKVSVLQEKSRTTEIARMLGGLQITSQSLSHAQEMLDEAHC